MSAPAICMIATIRPNNPITLANISTIKILTNKLGFWASARAAPDPTIPMQDPQNKLEIPTVNPAPKSL